MSSSISKYNENDDYSKEQLKLYIQKLIDDKKKLKEYKKKLKASLQKTKDAKKAKDAKKEQNTTFVYFRQTESENETVGILNPRFCDYKDIPDNPNLKKLILYNYWKPIPQSLINLEHLKMSNSFHNFGLSNFTKLRVLQLNEMHVPNFIAPELVNLEILTLTNLCKIEIPCTLVNLKELRLINTQAELKNTWINLELLIVEQYNCYVNIPNSYLKLKILIVNAKCYITIPDTLIELKCVSIVGKIRILPDTLCNIRRLILTSRPITYIPETYVNLDMVKCERLFHKTQDNIQYHGVSRENLDKYYNILLNLQRKIKQKTFYHKEHLLYNPLYIGGYNFKLTLKKILINKLIS